MNVNRSMNIIPTSSGKGKTSRRKQK